MLANYNLPRKSFFALFDQFSSHIPKPSASCSETAYGKLKDRKMCNNNQYIRQ